jgi:Mor family transcriptional regulator
VSDNLARVASLVRDLADLVGRVAIERLGLPADEAAALGLEAAQTFCSEFGGQHVYVPLGFAVRIEQRDREMFEEYVRSGRDIQAVVRAFNCSIHTAYRRVKLVEAAAYAARQQTLFDEPG